MISFDFLEKRLGIVFFFYTTDLHKHNTKTKKFIYGDQIVETKKSKNKIHIYVYINNVYNLF